MLSAASSRLSSWGRPISNTKGGAGSNVHASALVVKPRLSAAAGVRLSLLKPASVLKLAARPSAAAGARLVVLAGYGGEYGGERQRDDRGERGGGGGGYGRREESSYGAPRGGRCVTPPHTRVVPFEVAAL